MNAILVVNGGSLSVKFQLYEANDLSRLVGLVKGSIDGVGTRPRLNGEGVTGWYGSAPSMGRGTRHEKVGEAEDQVDREQLRTLEPI